MRDDSIVELYAVPEVFVDGFTRHVSKDGVMTCIGYRRMQNGNIVVIRLAWPAVNTAAGIEDAQEAMSAPLRSKHATAH